MLVKEANVDQVVQGILNHVTDLVIPELNSEGLSIYQNSQY